MKELDRYIELFKAYRKGINKIDDYFEYRAESKKDQKYVHTVLQEVSEDVMRLLDDR